MVIGSELAGITLAKLQANDQIYFKLSKIGRYAQKLLTLCKVPSLEKVFGE